MGANTKKFKNGIGSGKRMTSLNEFRRIKKRGYDHVRFLVRPDSLHNLPLDTYRAIRAKLRVVWSLDLMRHMNAEIFQNQNRHLRYIQMLGELAEEFPVTRLVVGLNNEPKWYKVDAGENRTLAEEVRFQWGKNALDTFRQYCPKHTVIMPTIGTGRAFYSENDFHTFTSFGENTWNAIHFYWPHIITHSKTEIQWPTDIPIDRMSDLEIWQNKIKPEDYIPEFTILGLRKFFDKMVELPSPYIEEWGIVYQRGTKAEELYSDDFMTLAKEYDIPICRWAG